MKYLKYLKFFESYRGTVSVNRDLFIKVLSDYSSVYDDGLVTQLEELGFESSDVIADMIEDSLNNGDRISLEAITLLVDEISSGNSERNASKLQDIYNECEYHLNNSTVDVIDNLKDIFSEYVDDKKAMIYKTGDKSDNRCVVLIKQVDVLLNIDFDEVLNRVKEFVNLQHMEYVGSKDRIKFEFYENYTDGD